ncbi:cysteine desulfurase family protein [Turneriella parva]|uniref:Aminotransferase class V n=1 Tax=Turneriella parva (strain ATCC BAA-1111 / DSM 21527 / NCTC 11395 / H) TaxID=869212 RepID=I4B6P7_TURPD|nr:cysteine desulfurase family protein [Turneriella parva]AFM12954.1 aminotransferase class V [Turneriella parva DSM 21527]
MSDSEAVRHGIYLDYFSTTPVDPRVLDYYCQILKENYGNPSSVDHDFGSAAARLVKASREKIADLIACDPGEITFTSGATESISLFLQGFAAAQLVRLGRKLKVITSPIEHPAVLENLHALQAAGSIDLATLDVDQHGRINLHQLENLAKSGVDLFCNMAVNNETGNIYPTDRIAAIASEHRALYFCDATQAIGKIPFSLASLPDTVVAFSGHKFYAPKGIGVLVADKSIPVKPLFFGGGQQRSLRPGTINAPLIAALGFALQIACEEQEIEAHRTRSLRDLLQNKLASQLPQLVVNGDLENRVAGALHVSLPGLNNKQLIARIRDEIAISTGAACSSGSERPSQVLKAMRLPKDLIEGALRISLGRFSSEHEIVVAAQVIARENRTHPAPV